MLFIPPHLFLFPSLIHATYSPAMPEIAATFPTHHILSSLSWAFGSQGQSFSGFSGYSLLIVQDALPQIGITACCKIIFP